MSFSILSIQSNGWKGWSNRESVLSCNLTFKTVQRFLVRFSLISFKNLVPLEINQSLKAHRWFGLLDNLTHIVSPADHAKASIIRDGMGCGGCNSLLWYLPLLAQEEQ